MKVPSYLNQRLSLPRVSFISFLRFLLTGFNCARFRLLLIFLFLLPLFALLLPPFGFGSALRLFSLSLLRFLLEFLCLFFREDLPLANGAEFAAFGQPRVNAFRVIRVITRKNAQFLVF